MDSSAVAVTLKGIYEAYQSAEGRIEHRCHWFDSIPPERIGLHGEFDYHGLSKRVKHCLSVSDKDVLERLKVRQRGRVVVLSGQLCSPCQLSKVVSLALSVDGVDDVEIGSVAVAKAC